MFNALALAANRNPFTMSGPWAHRRGGKKTRKLGKWVDGFTGEVTKKYQKWRKKKMKMASLSRAINRKRAK